MTYTVGSACVATASATVTITTAPVATFSYPTTSYCAAAQGNVAPVFGSGASAGTFSSTAGLSLNPATGIVNLAASTAGTYTVTNTIAASGSCAATAATSAITISPAPVAGISAGGATAICQGTAVLLTATGGGAGATYQFLLNGQAIAGATAGSYSASAAGSYAVSRDERQRLRGHVGRHGRHREPGHVGRLQLPGHGLLPQQPHVHAQHRGHGRRHVCLDHGPEPERHDGRG